MPPRTVADFAAANVPLLLWCGSCGENHPFGADVLELTFAPNFDVFANPRELARQLYYPACGTRRLSIIAETVVEPFNSVADVA